MSTAVRIGALKRTGLSWCMAQCVLVLAALCLPQTGHAGQNIGLDGWPADAAPSLIKDLPLPCRDCLIRLEARVLSTPPGANAWLSVMPLQNGQMRDDFVNIVMDGNATRQTLSVLAWIPPDADGLRLQASQPGTAAWHWQAARMIVLDESHRHPATQFVRNKLQFIESHALNEPAMGRAPWRQLVMRAASASTPGQEVDVLQFALALLPDRHHSRVIRLAPRTAKSHGADADLLPGNMPQSRRIGDMTLIKPTAFQTLDPATHQRYIDALGQLLKRAGDDGTSGIILDLREHGGGSVPALMTGLSQLFADPAPLGWGMDRQGIRSALFIADGRYVELEPAPPESAAVRQLLHERLSAPWRSTALRQLPLAILIGPGTASASEIGAFLLRQRAGTRLFGQASKGLLSGVEVFPLQGEIRMGLVTEAIIDTEGRQAPSALTPDVVTDMPLEAAQAWLKMLQEQKASPQTLP